MTGLLLAFLLASTPPHTVTLFDGTVMVGPSKTRTLDVDLTGGPARVDCSFQVLQGGSGVRVVLMREEDAGLWQQGEPHSVEASTSFARNGSFSHRPLRAERYVIVLDNRLEGRGPANVRLVVRLEYNEDWRANVQTADPSKGRILVWCAMGLFAVIALTFTTRLKRNLEG